MIDPVLTYATYLGGSNAGFCGIHRSGYRWRSLCDRTDLVGRLSDDTGAFQTVNLATSTNDVSTAFMCKLNATGTALLYSTYLGGYGVSNTEYGQGEYGHSIAVDTTGNAYVTGWTYSSDFPVTSGAYQTTNNAASTAEATGFVTKLNSEWNRAGLLHLPGRQHLG